MFSLLLSISLLYLFLGRLHSLTVNTNNHCHIFHSITRRQKSGIIDRHNHHHIIDTKFTKIMASSNMDDHVDGNSGVVNNENNKSEDAVSGAIDFLTIARGLKTTKRTGWVKQEVPNVESVADHSWRISLMAMIATSSDDVKIDVNKCIKMALVHDLAESIVGDITPHCGVSDEDKHQLEFNAMNDMISKLGTYHQMMIGNGNDILSLWKEYEEGSTEEAKLVKDLDKLEMILQALEYETDGNHGKSLDGFFDSTRGKWRTSIGQKWADEIESRRKLNSTSTVTKKQKTDDV